MRDRPSERSTLRTAIAYAIGFAISAAIFWILSKTGRRRSSGETLAPTPMAVANPNPRPGFERHDASARAITLVGIGFLVALTLVIVATTVLFSTLTGASPQLQLPPPGVAISASPPTPLPPPPRLETQPGQTLNAIQAQDEVILNSYTWVDRAHGIVRIPIDRAMVLVAEQGLPTRPGGQQGYQDTGTTLPSGPSSGRATEDLAH